MSIDNPEFVLYCIVPIQVRFMREWALEYHEVAVSDPRVAGCRVSRFADRGSAPNVGRNRGLRQQHVALAAAATLRQRANREPRTREPRTGMARARAIPPSLYLTGAVARLSTRRSDGVADIADMCVRPPPSECR